MIGQTVSHYRVIDYLGSGGMGDVYLAQDQRLRRPVALKILKASLICDEEQVRRFQQEAQAASALSHPNILTIFDFGTEGAAPFLVAEFIEGRTLNACQPSPMWGLQDAIEIILQIASGLAAAHKAGIVHCDIKPPNLMVRHDGLVKILDFGIARLAEKSTQTVGVASGAGLARRAEISGTANYMSPEQIAGCELDGRSDVFSLGVVFYEMLAARKPFAGDNMADILQAILQHEPPSLSHFREDIPLALEAFFRKVLEKNREARCPSMAQFRDDLQRLQHDLQAAHPEAEFATLETGKATDDGSATTGTGGLPAAGEAFSQSPIVRRVALYQKWWLTVGLAFLALTALDLVGWQGRAPVRDLGLLLLAALGLGLYVIARRKPSSRMSVLPKGAAFRGLLPFQEADRKRFYGREVETEALFAMIAHKDFRFGVLFGDSGAGKTSLLRAALVPQLWENAYAPIYCRSYKDPMAAILAECHSRSHIAPCEDESSIAYLCRVAEKFDSPLVMICDQFEEFFINFKTAEERQPFISFVAACHNAPTLPVKLLLSMRSDFLYLINAVFAAHIHEPLLTAKLFHLRNLDERRAAEIIDKSARQAHLPFESSLVKQVARQLADNGAVLPSELQIVGEQLQNKRIFTLQEYRRLGGKEALVHSFLEDVIQLSNDKEAAQLLLRCLISDENTRLTLTLEEIARRMQRSQVAVEPLVQLFVASRLLRVIQEDTPWRYELMHEYLIDRINQVTGKVMDAAQRANRLLRQYLSAYAVEKSTRIPVGKLLFIRRYADQSRTERARELMHKSFRRGLLQWSALALIMATVATLTAAAFSINEEWESQRLSDGHTAAVRQAVFSPDGRLLVSCGEDKKVMVWDFARRQRLKTFADHDGVVTGVAFSPDGKWLASASFDSTIIVRETLTFETAYVLRGHQTGINGLAFSPDGKFLVASSTTIIIWRVGNFEKISEIDCPLLGTPAFLPRSSRFSLDSRDDEITFVEAATGKSETHRIVGITHGWQTLSPDGRMRISIDGEGKVQFTDLEHHKILHAFLAHKDNGRSVAFSPDGKLAASASENVILWDPRTQTKIATLEHDAPVWNVSFSPDGRWLVSTHTDGTILIWDVAERQRVANLNEHSAAVYGVAYSPDGAHLASSSEDSSIIIWNAATGQKETVLIGHQTKANGVAFLPDGRQVISCGFQEPLILWDLAQGRMLRTFASTDPGMKGSNGFAVSPDGRWLASAHGVYEIADGRMVCRFLDKTQNDNPADDWLLMGSQIYGLAFSRDGRWLACATVNQGHIGLLDTQNWELVRQAQERATPFISLSFSPDGNYLATGDDNGNVELWSVTPLARLAVLGRHQARVKAVAFAPDGKQVVSSSDDKTIALWNASSRSLETRIGTHAAPIRAVAFSPDGKHLISGEHDQAVWIHTRHRTLWGYRLD